MGGRKSAVLAYHSIDPSGSVISTHPELFRRQMSLLAERAVPVVALDQARQTAGAVALTFDDGYRNFETEALPVLEKYRFPATVFVVTGRCGQSNDWAPRQGVMPSLALMDWEALRRVAAAGVDLGAHTVSHPVLPSLSEEAAERELRECRDELQRRLGKPVRTVSYPYGMSNPAVRRIAARHYQLACGTKLGYVSRHSDPWDLRRIDAYYLRRMSFFEQVTTGKGRAYLAVRRLLRTLHRRS